jgi:aspartate 1-decarboxylase
VNNWKCLPVEKVQIVNNFNRTRLVQPGDNIIIIAFYWITKEEIQQFNPNIAFADHKNKIVETSDIEIHGDIK